MFKRIIGFLLTVVIFICCSFSCFGIEYDGIPHNDEWMDSAVYSFENPDGFNNGVNFAYMRLIPKVQSNQLYLCFSMRVDDISSAENSAVLLSLNGDDEIFLKGTGNSPYNENLYNIEYAMAYDTGSKNIVYEIMLGVKHGFSGNDTLSVRLCDCNSMPSNVFTFDLSVIDGFVNDDMEPTSAEESSSKNKTSADKNNDDSGNTASKTKKSTKSTRKNSSSKGNSDDSFTFNKVKTNNYANYENQPETDEMTSTVNLSQQVVDNSSVKKKVLTAVGALCAVAVTTCAVYRGIKKSNKKEEKE
ncbi:MAG: hypothetical protein IJZ88_03945 [Clostridia bacterium]|nr:hypothetical protein [Clostridia bacterium]